MSDKIKLKLEKRSLTGRKVKQLRRQGILPANIYGKNIKSMAVQLSVKDFQTAFNQAGETNIIELLLNKETKPRPTLVANIHLHPVTGDLLHVDFHQVDLTKKVTVDIPIELIGEAPAVSKGGVLLQILDEVSVEALPINLPDKFEIDVSQLEEIGQGISLKGIKLDSAKVKILIDNLDELIVKIEEPAKEEEKPTEPTPAEGEEAAEVPAEGKEAPAEDEAVAEGEETTEAPAKDEKVRETKKKEPEKEKNPAPFKDDKKAAKPNKLTPKPKGKQK